MNFSSSSGPSFHLIDHYYLETQNTSRNQDDKPHYKVILKRGIFHQTLQRDIIFDTKIDSLKVLKVDSGKSMLLRGYSSKTTYVSSEVDSADVMIFLKVVKQGDVEYHL